MAPVPPAGALVATVGDLNAAVTLLTEKLEEQKRLFEAELQKVSQKQTDYAEKTDESLKSITEVTDKQGVEIEELKRTRVLNSQFTQQITNIEMKLQTDYGALEQLIKKCREDNTRDLTQCTQTLTAKVEAAESRISAVLDSVDAVVNEVIPDLRKQLEDERSKRMAGDLRLERADEELRDKFEKRCDEIIAWVKQHVEKSLAGLTDNFAVKEDLEKMLRDLAALRTQMTTQFSSIDDLIEGLNTQLKNHRQATQASFDQNKKEIGILMKDSNTIQSDLQQLTTSTTADFKKIKEHLRDQIAQLHRDLSEARAAAAQAAVNNEKNIQVVAGEVTPLKEARSVLFDRLKIKDVAGLVRDWQAGHVPTTTASLSDLEARVARLKTDLQTEHDHGVELQKSVTAVRGHFKMFHSIASGLDPSDSFGQGGATDTKLPPINATTSAMGQDVGR